MENETVLILQTKGSPLYWELEGRNKCDLSYLPKILTLLHSCIIPMLLLFFISIENDI